MLCLQIFYNLEIIALVKYLVMNHRARLTGKSVNIYCIYFK